MKNSVKIETIKLQLMEFKKAWTAGFEQIVKAAEIYVRALNTSTADAKLMFETSFTEVPKTVWFNLEKVGRHEMHYLLLMDASPAGIRLRKIPYVEQEQAMTNGLSVFCNDGKIVRKRVSELSYTEALRAVSPVHIRSTAEQEDILRKEDIMRKKATKAEVLTWGIVTARNKSSLYIYKPTRFTKAELLDIIEKMK